MAESSPAVRTNGLTKTFRRQALSGVDLEVPRGSVFALLGPSVAGKTTTIRILLNLLWPTSGEIEVLGMNGVTRSLEIRRRVGYQAETQLFYRRAVVEDVINLCRSLHQSWNSDRVKRYCDIFDLPVRYRVAELSKGKMTLLGLILAAAFVNLSNLARSGPVNPAWQAQSHPLLYMAAALAAVALIYCMGRRVMGSMDI